MSTTFAMADGDWVIEPNGQPKMISGISKAGQDVVHALSHPYNRATGYGFEFLDSVQVLEGSAAPGILKRDVSSAISRLMALQSQLKSRLDDSERITGVKRIDVVKQDGGMKYTVQFGVGVIRRSEVAKAFIVTTRHRL